MGIGNVAPGTGRIGAMTQSSDHDALRVGDRDRELAVSVLHEAVGGGYLDLAEFEERSRTVYAARTRGELRAALADLPDGIRLFPPAGPTGTDGSLAVASPGAFVPAADTIVADWTTVKRQGAWVVPARIAVTGTMGTADLDLRCAAMPANGCLIDVLTSCCTVKIRLDASTVVRTGEFVSGSMTTLKDKAGPPTVPGGAVVEVRGRPSWTTVVIRRG
jgi:hypothetical protein